jgi:hypothetical protein
MTKDAVQETGSRTVTGTVLKTDTIKEMVNVKKVASNT